MGLHGHSPFHSPVQWQEGHGLWSITMSEFASTCLAEPLRALVFESLQTQTAQTSWRAQSRLNSFLYSSWGQTGLAAAGETLGLGRKLCAADRSHSKAGLGHRHPALVLSSWASSRICAQKPRPTVIPLETDVRQLVPSTSTMEPNKVEGGESTAQLYPLLGNNSQAENHKSPWQGTKEKSCKHQGMSPSKLPNAQSCCHLSTQTLRQTLRGSRAG